jgi:hypothetical protein
VIHDLADLLGVRLGQRSAEHGEVLAEHEHQPSVDRAVPRHDAVAQVSLAVEPEVRRTVGDERVQLDQRALVEQQRESLASRQLAPSMLLIDSLLPATEHRFRASRLELLDLFAIRGHPRLSSIRGLGNAGIVPVTAPPPCVYPQNRWTNARFCG